MGISISSVSINGYKWVVLVWMGISISSVSINGYKWVVLV
jgi:hypothetical protein